MTKQYQICPASEIQPGERKIVEIEGLSIGIFNIDGEFFGLLNTCPHQLAELCRGQITGITTSPAVGEFRHEREGEIIRCPRHRWAFDIATGESVFNPHLSTRTFDVETESVDNTNECEEYGTALAGDEPPVETYDVTVEDEIVVLSI